MNFNALLIKLLIENQLDKWQPINALLEFNVRFKISDWLSVEDRCNFSAI